MKPSAMYSGQFEMRRVPLAGPLSWEVELDVPLSDPQAARNDGPRPSAAAAAAPPPMKRRREVRFAVNRAISLGSIVVGESLDMATVPFVGSGGGTGSRRGVPAIRKRVRSRRASPRDPRSSEYRLPGSTSDASGAQHT